LAVNDRKPVAVFDLDVTLTRRDTYLPFLFGYVKRYPRRWISVAMLLVRTLSVWRWQDRRWLKEQFLLAFLGGEPRERVRRWSEEFAVDLFASGMRTQGLDRLKLHQQAGHRVVLASASFDSYVTPLAKLLAIDEVIATRILWNDADRVAGVDGDNCREQAKLARVVAHLGGHVNGQGVTAYSDSYADLPLLTWAERGIAICPSRRLAERVEPLGLAMEKW
jgi:phosphatidylglycerophosphatase C